MWMVDPIILCTKGSHLQGEHSEIHKHKHNFEKHHSIDGRMSPVIQIEPSSMQARHDALAAELLRRGGTHKSPYTAPDISYLPEWQQNAEVDQESALHELLIKCQHCRERYAKYFVKNKKSA